MSDEISFHLDKFIKNRSVISGDRVEKLEIGWQFSSLSYCPMDVHIRKMTAKLLLLYQC